MWSSPSQESGGPMCRSVFDCAAVLDAIAGYDAADLATQAGLGKIPTQPYTSFVSADGLRGARVGVLREMVRAGSVHEEGRALFEQALADFKAAGAVVIDPIDTGLGFAESQALARAPTFERAAAIDAYLTRLPDSAPISSVAEMIEKGGDLVKPTIIEAAKIGSLDHHKELVAAMKHQTVMREALLELMDRYELDGIILPYRTAIADEAQREPRPAGAPERNTSATRNALASYTGLPTIVVPGGFFASDGMPFAVQFLGKQFDEPTLIALASGYEAVTAHRAAPESTPALPNESLFK